MNLIEAARCIKKRCPVLGTYIDGASFYTKEYPYIYKVTASLDMSGRLIYSAELADVLALSGEPRSTVTLKLDNVRVSPYKQ